jgi:hypothetical protein
MLALLATIAFLQSAEADPPPAPPAPPPAPALVTPPPLPDVERGPAAAPQPPPRGPRAPVGLPAPPAPAPPPALPAPGSASAYEAGSASGDVLRGAWPEKPSGKRVTIDDRNSIDDTLEAIADAAGWSISCNTGRVGERLLVVKLRDVPVEEALRAALQGTGLAATRRGNVVSVAPSISPVTARPALVGFDKPSGKRFSGDFSDLDGRDALLEIGKAAGISIVLPPGTLGKVTGHFKDVPVEEALKAVLSQAGLRAVREGSIVTVSPHEEGLAGRFEFSGELGPAIQKTVDEALRGAERELRRSEREQRAEGRAGRPRDREQVGGDVVVEAGESARDVHAVGGSVILRSGAEAREVVAVGGSVTLEPGASCRQAVAVGGDVRVGPGASVEQDAVSVGGRVQVDPSGDVGGQRTAVPIPGVSALLGKWTHRAAEEDSPGWSLASALARYAVYLALALLLMLLFPRRVEVVGASIEANPVKSLLAGLLGLLAQPFLSILLIVTLIGIPLVLVQVLGVLVAGVFGFTALAWWLGRRLPLQLSRGAMVLQLALGLAIIFLATQIPVLGWLVWTAVVLLTFGGVLRTRFGQEPVLPTSAMPPPYPPSYQPPPYHPPPVTPPQEPVG